jgi:hypothetical protein
MTGCSSSLATDRGILSPVKQAEIGQTPRHNVEAGSCFEQEKCLNRPRIRQSRYQAHLPLRRPCQRTWRE